MKLYFTQLLAENYSQKGNSIERQVQKGKKVSFLFGQVNFIFFLYSCLFGFAFFWPVAFLAKTVAFLVLNICLSGSHKSRLVRHLVVRDLPFWF
jgi:hypothetical protein